jgi:cobalt/nickel transport system permease protein
VSAPEPGHWLSSGPTAAPGLVDAIDPRVRIVAAAAFALVVVAIGKLPALLAALAAAAALARLARLPAVPTLARLAAVESFLVVVLAFLPFTVPGTPVVSLGPLVATAEGLHRAAEIVLTANAVMLALLALVGTMEPAALGHALARLRVPAKLVHLLLFTIRYVAVLQGEYGRLRQAMKARGFRPRGSLHTWRSIGWLFAMLLVRSFERAERIVEAMKCRGFSGRYPGIDPARFAAGDIRFALALSGLLAALAGIEGMA